MDKQAERPLKRWEILVASIIMILMAVVVILILFSFSEGGDPIGAWAQVHRTWLFCSLLVLGLVGFFLFKEENEF